MQSFSVSWHDEEGCYLRRNLSREQVAALRSKLRHTAGVRRINIKKEQESINIGVVSSGELLECLIR